MIYRTICLVVEGISTEKQFCERILKPYFNSKNIQLQSYVIKTKKSNSDPAYRGGSVSIESLCENLGVVNNPNFLVSTLVDYYGFINNKNIDIDELENNLLEKVKQKYPSVLKNNNFIPYIQKYEIEAFLFCDLKITTKYLGINFNKNEKNRALEKLNDSIKNKEPEDVNNGRETAPSKRIEKIFKQYNKGNLDFSSIIEEIGIEKLKNTCPRFNNWLKRLEEII